MVSLRQLRIDTGYCLLGFPLALVSFCVLVTGFSAGVGMLVVVIGLPILTATLFIGRAFADIERLRFPAVLRLPRTRPTYRVPPPDAGLWKRMVMPLTEAQFWLDLVHGLLHFPIAVTTFCIVVSWWASGIAGTLTVFWDWSIPRGPDNQSLAQLIGLGDSAVARIGFQTAVGVLCLVTLPFVVRGCALVSSYFSRFLLTGVAEMRQTITVLTEQKAAAASAEATALRRLERDIHDGPQQRLVRLAMDLSRARRHLDTDPDAMRATLDEALVQTQETLDELRVLSRGIAPPVLTDRGLPSALAALAVRCTVPVELAVDPELGMPAGRLDPAVETAVYFAVAEALTNVAKHSGAAYCWITVAHGPEKVGVEITDDGNGGAHLAKGHGLSGLDDRVRAVGGTLTVTSPVGGPTTIGVTVPC
ncbi:sensor histidine kinase [Mycobacterium sp. 236(2023)]|uniref:sensor histidine kinase n=1 Tax=Mycobacterium sp. 236(2023) TaxID=3038163 RepID=UPI002414F264|nr:sensor histidine kinase [Mycobacterium sp. 236(2023)]MDG4667137.1 sensor domain-containing protein [Mycobacterium sp. 236(2023)]